MKTYRVIEETGKIIVKLLRENLSPELIDKPESIELCIPTSEGDFNLTVYLYAIHENTNARNMNSNKLSLDLFYLITAFSKAEDKLKAYEESMILGKAMQTLSSKSLLRGSITEGSIAETGQEIQLSLQTVSTDEISKIWTFPNLPYKLSVVYRAGPVHIDLPSIKKSQRVIS